jgi:two-component system OmpR family sensor kinase
VTPARRPWSLQARLIVTITSIVAMILVAVGLATGAILRSILVQSLDTQIESAARDILILPTSTAQDVLASGRQEAGTLLILHTFDETTGAVVSESDEVSLLSPAQMQAVVSSLPANRTVWATVRVPGEGEYRVLLRTTSAGFFAILGVPTTELTATLARIVTTVTLLTTGGLLLLSAVIALVIRRSLRPLRSVAAPATRVAAQPLAEGDVRISERVPAEEADAADEIGSVGAALNTLLDHVDASLSARQRNEARMRAFVADASHELRTPLASIRGYSELSLRALRQAGDAPGPVGEATEQSLERIQAQSLRMTALVEDLLLLARLDEGTELVYGAVDLTRIAIEAVADATPTGPDHEWRLDVGEEPVIVAGDGSRLQQVVVNLLANARVHTPPGTVVTTSVSLEGGTAVLRVHDDGPGVDPSLADALFERFSRGDSSRARHTGGTGLGLSIVQAIVTAHGGTIAVDSAPGSTTFEVRLPARPAAPDSAGASDDGLAQADIAPQ